MFSVDSINSYMPFKENYWIKELIHSINLDDSIWGVANLHVEVNNLLNNLLR